MLKGQKTQTSRYEANKHQAQYAQPQSAFVRGPWADCAARHSQTPGLTVVCELQICNATGAKHASLQPHAQGMLECMLVQVGACIVNPEQVIVGIGYNGFPRGVHDSKLPWAKKSRTGNILDTKYPYVRRAHHAVLHTNSLQTTGLCRSTTITNMSLLLLLTCVPLSCMWCCTQWKLHRWPDGRIQH